MQQWARQIHFTEDGVEFNQIGCNLAMICATIAPRSLPDQRRLWANPQQRQIAPVRLRPRKNTLECVRARKTGQAS
jgi:hypothetical protein